MTVAFPALPRGTVVSPHLVRVGGDLVSALGGPTQRITRLGSRYAASVELPTLDPVCAGRWLACPLQAEAMGDTLSLAMPQMLDVSSMFGLAGTGSAGSPTVVYTGATPAAGMWFSFQAGGRHYLHLVTSVDAAGRKATVAPLLRKALSNTPMEFAKPVLEGFVDDTVWSVEFFRFVGHKFTITESA